MTDSQIIIGSKVTLHFTLSLEDGTIVDRSEDGEPMNVIVGDKTLVEGLEYALLGLRAGDKQTLVIPPESGFGYPDEAAIQWMDRSEFPSDINPKEGQIIGFTMPDSMEVPGTIKEVTEDRVKVDLNHPLSGHDVTFDVIIVDVINPDPAAEP